MSMFIVPTPLFDANMSVEAYWLRSHDGKKMLGVKDNFLRMDDVFSHPGLHMVEAAGIEPLTGGKPLFFTLSRMQLMAGLVERTRIEPDKLVCDIPAECVSDPEAAQHIQRLYERGYHIALDRFPEDPDLPVMQCVEYIILDYADPQLRLSLTRMDYELRGKIAVIRSVPDMDAFTALKKNNTRAYFGGSFYSEPITQKKANLSPIKVNALHLLSDVNQEDFELDDIVKTIERDPYLSLSLLKFLGSVATGLSKPVDSIKQAVTILGQDSVRRWATIALSASLGEDRPDEITKLALVRAKFSEDIAIAFELGVYQSSLFIAGLFSLLDVMLERPMEDALKEVAVSPLVKEVLLEKQGPLAPVMELVRAYERADWDKVSILMIQNHTDMDHVSQAYLDALVWYRNLLQSIDAAEEEQGEDAPVQ